jgi:UDP-glucose 4-epimerase
MTTTQRETGGLTVAVTGATGEIGRPFVRQLEKTPGVGSIRAMARRPFTPGDHDWTRTEFIQGDVTRPEDIAKLVEGADVVVHLAFLILGDRKSTRVTNLDGSRNVFKAAVAAGCSRIVYTSSIAAYGFSADHPPLITEETPPAGTEHLYYSAQKAELERALAEAVEGTATEAFVFRPPFVGGPNAHGLLLVLPPVQMAPKLPAWRLVGRLSRLTHVLPDFGVPLQIVHVDDVAAALCAGVAGNGPPGVYNIAAPGELTMTEVADALGWRVFRLPQAVAHGVAEIQRRLPAAPAMSDWVQSLTVPVIMSTAKAERELGWRPTRDAATTLRETVASAHATGLAGVG